MRLLVLDGSRVLVSLVQRLAPQNVTIETASCFQDALTTLTDDPPDAVIVNVPPSPLSWRDLKRVCHRHDPPIPVLFESCIHGTPEEAGIGHLGPESAFLTKPYPVERLEKEIEGLVTRAHSGHL